VVCPANHFALFYKACFMYKKIFIDKTSISQNFVWTDGLNQCIYSHQSAQKLGLIDVSLS
jgi:hypothetical protein